MLARTVKGGNTQRRRMKEAVKGVIVDFGGVFTKTGKRRQVSQSCEAELGLRSGSISELLFTGQHWWDVSTGKISQDKYWQQVRKALGRTIPTRLEPFRYNPFAYEQLNQAMVLLVRRLHRYYKVALLSNATPYLDTLLDDYCLAGLFDTVVNSSRVGWRKPEPEIYWLTCQRLGLTPAECLFIDDKERNTQAAESLGMTALVFRSVAQLGRDLAEIGVQVCQASSETSDHRW